MNMQRAIHKTAIVALFVVALMSIINTVRSPLKGVTSVEHALHPILGFALWSVLIWKIWKRPQSWGFGVGIFLLLVIVFQTYLWRLAIANPVHNELGIASTMWGFVLYEVPLAVGALCCILLRWRCPNEAHRIPT